MSEERLVVAIDGPSGSGKSSTARGVASRLGLAFLDTGAMYRAATWLMLREGLTDADAVAARIAAVPITTNLDPEVFTIAIDGVDVTEAIRHPRVSAAVSTVATNLAVRADLAARQRVMIDSAEHGIVAEGRDITTVVAPDAHVRVLLVADPSERVSRRQAELGNHVHRDQVSDQVIRRDRDDSAVAEFLDAAPGVTVIDSTELDLDGVIAEVCSLVAERVG